MITVVDALRGLISDAGLPVDVARAPEGYGNPSQNPFRSYVMLTPLKSPTDGALNDGDSDAWTEMQATCVGRTANAAMTVSRTVIAAVQGQRISTATRESLRPIHIESYLDIDRDDTAGTDNSVFMAFVVFSVPTTPATAGS